jgi:hypothetical protein
MAVSMNVNEREMDLVMGKAFLFGTAHETPEVDTLGLSYKNK